MGREIARVRSFVGLVFAVMLASCAPPAARQGTHAVYKLVKAKIAPEHRVRLGDLVGLSPTAVQQKLTGLPSAWPTPMGLDMASPDGTLAFANLGEWMSDSAGHDLREHLPGATNSTPAGFSHCNARFADAKDAPMSVGFDLRNGHTVKTLVKDTLAWGVALEFRNDHFVQAWREPNEPRKPGAPTLESGASFMSKWDREPLGPEIILTTQCWRTTSVRQSAAGAGPPADLAGGLQGLMLLPLSGKLPALNARRAEAMRDGTGVYDALAPGIEVPGGVAAFAAKHPVITVLPGTDPTYVLLQVDLGAYPSRNLTYFHHEALIGVRDEHVLFRMHLGEQAPWGLGTETELPVRGKRSDQSITG